jgi:hypothetical protein
VSRISLGILLEKNMYEVDACEMDGQRLPTAEEPGNIIAHLLA